MISNWTPGASEASFPYSVLFYFIFFVIYVVEVLKLCANTGKKRKSKRKKKRTKKEKSCKDKTEIQKDKKGKKKGNKKKTVEICTYPTQTNPCQGQGVTQGQFLSRVKPVWIQFSFFETGCLSKAKETSLLFIHSWGGGKIHAISDGISTKGNAHCLIQDLNTGRRSSSH